LDEKSYRAVYRVLKQAAEPVFSSFRFGNEMKNSGLLLSILCRICIFMVDSKLEAADRSDSQRTE
jgi:hypothetical protein